MKTLAEWLEYIERLHPQAIALGLERVQAVRQALDLELVFPLITVGGTNGKGSVCALLDAILRQAGYRVGCYMSPHLLRYNERVRLGGREASDAELVQAFAAVERARRGVPLTYFEFGTLAAMWLLVRGAAEVGVLEVGLGGRLDAVNAFDADCAVVTTVDIDHVDFLGGDREAIGYEKAGIFRPGRPAVCADVAPPASLVGHAGRIGAQLLRAGREFGFVAQNTQWQYWGPQGKRNGLPHPALRGTCQLGNAAAAITALDCLRERLPVSAGDIRAGLLQAENPGRFQVLPGRPLVVLDVAHNPQAARALAASLDAMGCTGRTIAVFAILRDKDVDGVIAAMKPRVADWLVAGLGGPRGTAAAHLQRALASAGVDAVTACDDVAVAYAQASERAGENDRIVVFGSFYTVASVMQYRASRGGGRTAPAGKAERGN